MNKIVLYMVLLFSSFKINAQQTPVTGKNIIKLNLSGAVFRNISAQYERQLGRKTSVAFNANLMPFGKVPFESVITDQVGVEEIKFDKMKVGSFGVVPEFRFYLGKEAMRGFYIGPFVAYKNYQTNLPVNYGIITERIGIFDGEVNTITGGLQLGAQFRLSDRMTLDWWILGPNFGSGTGDLVFTGSLDPAEQQRLRQEIEDIKQELPFDLIKSYNVSSSGASIRAQGPVAGLRGFGFNLGVRF
jgi:hypothetical protein